MEAGKVEHRHPKGQKLSSHEIKKRLEQRASADRLSALQSQTGWHDIKQMLVSDFCDKLDEMFLHRDKDKVYALKMEMEATIKFAKKIGQAISVGDAAAKKLEGHFDRG